MQVVHVYPDDITKVVLGEPLTFYVEAEMAADELSDCPGKLQVEIWTTLPCKETRHRPELGFAAKLHFRERKGNILFFTRTLTPTQTGFYEYSIRYRLGEQWKWYGGTAEHRTIMQLHVEPETVQSLIIYNAFVRQFGAHDDNQNGIIEPGEGGTFQDLIDAMPHFKKLGINTLYLNPIQKTGDLFRYPDKIRLGNFQDETNVLPWHMHPGSVYSIQDYKSIDAELGLTPHDDLTDQYREFKRFVQVCHAQNISVIMDMVFDHTSKDSIIQKLHPEWYLYKRNPNSLEEPYVYLDDYPQMDVWGRPEHVFSPFDHGIFWEDCGFLNWNFRYPYSPQPARPNPSIKHMREYFKNLLKYWVKNYGIDGFRLDVAYAIPPEFWHEAIEDTRAYARTLKKEEKGRDIAPLSPDITFIGETYTNDLVELQSCGMTCLNGDYTWKLFNVDALKGYLDYIYNTGKQFPNGSRWLLFPECHDGDRLPQKAKDLLKNPDSDARMNRSRWVLTALLPGIPLLHNGYEVVEHEQVSVRTYTPIHWDSGKDITEYIGKVNTIRKAHPAFQKGKYVFVPTEQGVTPTAQLFCFLRDHKEKKRDTFLVVVNMDINNKADHVVIDLPLLEDYDWNRPFFIKDLLTNKKYERSSHFITIVLEPGESHIFRVTQK